MNVFNFSVTPNLTAFKQNPTTSEPSARPTAAAGLEPWRTGDLSVARSGMAAG
jgi:hypothetical protein